MKRRIFRLSTIAIFWITLAYQAHSQPPYQPYAYYGVYQPAPVGYVYYSSYQTGPLGLFWWHRTNVVPVYPVQQPVQQPQYQGQP